MPKNPAVLDADVFPIEHFKIEPAAAGNAHFGAWTVNGDVFIVKTLVWFHETYKFSLSG